MNDNRVVELQKRRVELPSPREPMAVARRLVATHYQTGRQLRLRRWRGGWWAWRTTHWAEVDEPHIRAEMYSFTEHATYLDTSKKIPTTEPWAPNRYRVADLLDALGAICHLRDDVHPPEWLTRAARVPPAGEFVAVENGLLHVPSRILHPHDAGLFNLVAVPFAYVPEIVEPRRWLQFLHELWPGDGESIAALQEFFGYVISGRTDLHKIMLLVGPTRAGKGVIARILEAMPAGRNSISSPNRWCARWRRA